MASQTVVLAGFGVDNEGILGPLLEVGPAEVVVELDEPSSLSELRTERLAGLGIAVAPTGSVGAVDAVIRSPGWPRSRSDVLDRRARGARITSGIALWLESRPTSVTLGITGTKGKSTTATLAEAVALEHGLVAHLAGNIGVPIWSIDPAPGSLVIIECSSYQAAEVTRPPSVGVLTSLSPDHVSWHGSYEQYVADKLQLFGAGFPAGGDDQRVEPGRPVLVPVSDPELARVLEDHSLSAEFTAPCDVALLGDHNRANAGLAATGVRRACELLGVSLDGFDAAAARALSSAAALPGRFRLVHVGQHRWIDDSLASNPFGAAAGVRAAGPGPLVLIVGGDDRAVSPDPLVQALLERDQGATWVVGLASTSAPLADAARSAGIDTHLASDLSSAASLASDLAPAGGTILFSPGAPTPAGEGNWATRSAVFTTRATQHR